MIIHLDSKKYTKDNVERIDGRVSYEKCFLLPVYFFQTKNGYIGILIERNAPITTYAFFSLVSAAFDLFQQLHDELSLDSLQ